MKWGMVLAGASDFSRPAESLSFTQNFALMCTGAIWTRWCFVIRPKNVALAAVNFLVFCVGATQVGRIYAYNKSIEGTESQAKGEMKDLKHTAEKAEQKAEKLEREEQPEERADRSGHRHVEPPVGPGQLLPRPLPCLLD